MYERFILRSKAAGFKPYFFAVNAGGSELTKQLGGNARGMIVSQVTPSPDNGRIPVIREFQTLWRAAYPNIPMSHEALEGYLSAKALIVGLQRSASNLTTENFIRQLHSSPLDLGGLDISYAPQKHAGLRYVELSFVRDDGTFAY